MLVRRGMKRSKRKKLLTNGRDIRESIFRRGRFEAGHSGGTGREKRTRTRRVQTKTKTRMGSGTQKGAAGRAQEVTKRTVIPWRVGESSWKRVTVASKPQARAPSESAGDGPI